MEIEIIDQFAGLVNNPLVIIIAICGVLALLLFISKSGAGKDFAKTCIVIIFVYIWMLITDYAIMPALGLAWGCGPGYSLYDGTRIMLYLVPLFVLIYRAVKKPKQTVKVERKEGK
ncbi:MAG: hypothetical protein JRJ62_12025 [Deltaproteobacteria bacterium]|nr:hypothetical protein [Deltaproteobacteria bacterium]